MTQWRSDVVGSLLRPAYLLAAREDLERGAMSPTDFKRIEDRAVDEAVALQESRMPAYRRRSAFATSASVIIMVMGSTGEVENPALS
jgi:hypothetical protein